MLLNIGGIDNRVAQQNSGATAQHIIRVQYSYQVHVVTTRRVRDALSIGGTQTKVPTQGCVMFRRD